MSTTTSLDHIGVGIDTARYGHRVSFLRIDRKPAAKPLTFMENHQGYQALKDRLNPLRDQHPRAHFHVRIDAAGQYAVNLEQFLRSLDLPVTISIGEPKRNKDYQKAHFPKRTTDDTESQALARFAVVEQPQPTPAPSEPLLLLREVASRLQERVKQTTQAINRLHNLLVRTFPELATLTNDISTGWVLRLLDKYPTAERIAQAHRNSLEKSRIFPPARPRRCSNPRSIRWRPYAALWPRPWSAISSLRSVTARKPRNAFASCCVPPSPTCLPLPTFRSSPFLASARRRLRS